MALFGHGRKVCALFYTRGLTMPIRIEPIVLQEGRYFTKRLAAARCGVALETMQSWVKQFGLPVIRVGSRGYLIAQADLEAFTPPRGARSQKPSYSDSTRRKRFPMAVEGIALPEGRYFTKRQVSQLRGVTVQAVERWIRFKYLAAVRADTLGWLIEEQTLAAFKPPPLGPRPDDSPLPPPPEKERARYRAITDLIRARVERREQERREGKSKRENVKT